MPGKGSIKEGVIRIDKFKYTPIAIEDVPEQ